jgi:DNA-binding GntR family transcriptional regulator
MADNAALGADTDDSIAAALTIKLDRRQSVSDQIYASLKRAIVSVRLPPGTSISENRICRHMGVSRTPVREAIIRLVEDELIDVFPQQGSFVAPIKLSTIHESHFVRKALEVEVLRRAASTWTATASASLRALIARQEAALAAATDDAFHELDEAFHRQFCSAASLDGVWNTIRSAKSRVDRLHRLSAIQGRLPLVVIEHRAVIDALDAGEADLAVERLVYHLDRALHILETLRLQHEKYFVE